jgi:hypothetical protein
MGIFLVRSQRDMVYGYLLVDASGIASFTTLVRGGDLGLARRLRSRFEEDMRLLDQIGWEPKGRQEVYAITLPSDEIRGIFRRLMGQAAQLLHDPPLKSVLVQKEATEMVEIARIVFNELPGGTR